jgi:hypothetical protein
MKKSIKGASTSASNQPPNTCAYYCDHDTQTWNLFSDFSEPGYWCPDDVGPCDPEIHNDSLVIDAIEIEEFSSASAKKAKAAVAAGPTLPKNTALYIYDTKMKLLRRTHGKWEQGYMAPYMLPLRELAKIDKKLAEIASNLVKTKAIASFELIVPAQKTASGKSVAKKKPIKPAAKTVAKKSTSSTKKKS